MDKSAAASQTTHLSGTTAASAAAASSSSSSNFPMLNNNPQDNVSLEHYEDFARVVENGLGITFEPKKASSSKSKEVATTKRRRRRRLPAEQLCSSDISELQSLRDGKSNTNNDIINGGTADDSPLDIRSAFCNDGYIGPIDILSKEEAAYALQEVLNELHTNKESSNNRFKLHLVLPCIDKIVHNPTLVHAVQQALNSNDILLWSSDINIKESNSDYYFEPHQDSKYAGLSPSSCCLTAWIALSNPVGIHEGCLQFHPKSHNLGYIPHHTKKNTNNMLSLGQYIESNVMDTLEEPISIQLRGGQATLHSFDIVHSSGPNQSNGPRVGLALRYIRADVIQTKPIREMVTWISGTTNQASNFDTEPRLPIYPTSDDINRGREAQKEAIRREELNYFSSNHDREKKSYS